MDVKKDENNFQIEPEIIQKLDTRSKSAERLVDEIKIHNNNYSKEDRSYRVGNYLIKNTLGCGTFGKVKLAIYLPTHEKVAIKILEKSKMAEKDDQIRLEREFEMLAQFNHPNLIMVTEIFESDNNYYTVMDYCEGGELFNYIVKKKYLSEKESSFFYYQIISGLEYMHSLGIVHRDLKPENLLLTKDHILKIIDFGLSNYFKEGQNDLLYTPCGSPCYASPEMVTGNNYDGVMIDIWSTGIILFAMLCGYLPFEDKNNEKLFKKIAECKIEYPEYLSDIALDLLKRIIVPNPKKRITICEIKNHPFYLKGKKLFDQEFTIQYLNEENINTENKVIDDKIKNNEINKSIKKDSNNIEKNIKKENKEKSLNKEDVEKDKKDLKEINNENNNLYSMEKKDNYNKYAINDDNNLNNDVKNESDINDISKNNINENINISNNSINKPKKMNEKQINLSKEKKETREIQAKKNKNISNELLNQININNEFYEEKLNNDLIQSINELPKEKTYNNNLINIEETENNQIISISTNLPNRNNKINQNKNMGKIKTFSEKKSLILINNLNESLDNKKFRSDYNNKIINTNSKDKLNSTKEKNKKYIENNKYNSNTLEIKKIKNKMKNNKVINKVLGKILKINIIEKAKKKKGEDTLNNNDNIKIYKEKKITEEEYSPNTLDSRNSYYEENTKIIENQKILLKDKETKKKIIKSEKNKIINPKTKYFALNPYNYHKIGLSSDIKNNPTEIDIHKTNSLVKNVENIHISDNNNRNKSVREEFSPTSIKKKGNNNNFTSKYGQKNILYKNKKNKDVQDNNLKTEENEVLHTDIITNTLEQNYMHKFMMNKNIFQLESKLSHLKKEMYKKTNTGVYSSNNLNYFKIKNRIILKNENLKILNDGRFTSNKKKNYKRKFNNLTKINNIHYSENKTKRFTKIFRAKKTNEPINTINNSYLPKLKTNDNFKSSFINYNKNITNNNKKNSSNNKTLKNEKILNFSTKYPIYQIENGISTISYELKNKNIYKDAYQQIKNNPSYGKYIKQIKKNNNYIHIKKKQINSEKEKRNKSNSIIKSKTKQKSKSPDENLNPKDTNSMINPFHSIIKTPFLNNYKNNFKKHKINLTKNNIYEKNNNITNTINPLVNIKNTFINFNMYPKYYLDPKKQLSSPKVNTLSPKNLKYPKKYNSNMKISIRKKIASSIINKHLRKNTSPILESPSKNKDINNLMNIQQNIFNNIENPNIFYYANTEYEPNISLDIIKNMKNNLLNSKINTISKDEFSNKKINNYLTNINLNRNSNIIANNLSNTISPKNPKKSIHKIKFNNLKKNFIKTKLNMNTINNISKKNKNYFTYFYFENIPNSNKKRKNIIDKFIQKNKRIKLPNNNFNTISNDNLRPKFRNLKISNINE